MKVKKRSEIEKKYKWGLESIYENRKQLEENLNQIEILTKKIEKLKGKITSTEKTFLNYLNLSERLGKISGKAYVYVSLLCDGDLSNAKNKELSAKVYNVIDISNEKLSFTSPEILKTDYSIVKNYIKENKELKKYKKSMEEFFKYKKHVLSEKEEKIISVLDSPLGASANIFSIITNVDFDFGYIRDEKYKKVKLTNGNASKYMESKSRRVRKQAYQKRFKVYKKFNKTLAETYRHDVKTTAKLYKLKNFNGVLSGKLEYNEISMDVYNNLIKTVNKNIHLKRKYVGIVKRILGYKKMYAYDGAAPIVKNFNKKYPFEESKQIILEALKPMGEDYLKIIQKAFDERWIDVYENENKRQGGYSWGSYETHPFILLNYQDNYNSISTLAHELGHAVHTYLSNKNQDYIYAGYAIFNAEIASNVNEMLLADYLLKKADTKKEKIFILDKLIDGFLGSMYVQTMFAEFEKEVYETEEKTGVLSAEILNDIYKKLEDKYSSGHIEKSEFEGISWSRIPHFYTPFYVYQYATGIAAAWSFANDILAGNEEVIKKYKEFLSSGGKDYPLKLLKKAGVDMEDEKCLQKAFKQFEGYVNKLDELTK